MKKFFSLVLALVMALSLTTVAWGAPTKTVYVDAAGSDANDGLTAATAVATLSQAVTLVGDGDTISIAAGTYAGIGAPAAADYSRLISISIIGAGVDATIIEDGFYWGYDHGHTVDKTVTVKGITFKGAGLTVADIANVVIDGNKFVNISGHAAIAVLDQEYDSMEGSAVITNNVIDGVAGTGVGIEVRNGYDVTITGNTIKNTGHNSLQLTKNSALAQNAGVVSVTGNTLENWGVSGEGRAMRINPGVDDGTTAKAVTIESNVMTHTNAPEEFVKMTAVDTNDTASLSNNYWNGVAPTAAMVDADNTAVATYYTTATGGALSGLTSNVPATSNAAKYTMWGAKVAATATGVNYVATDMQLPDATKAVAPVAPALNGSVAYYTVFGTKYVQGTADDCDVYFTIKGKTVPVLYLKEIGSQNYIAAATEFTNFGKACGQVKVTPVAGTKYYTYTDANDVVYVYAQDVSTGAMANTTDFLLVNNKMVPVVTTNLNTYKVPHSWAFSKNAKGVVDSAKCVDCGVTAAVYSTYTAVPTGADYIREGAYFLVINAPVVTDKVESAETFDAGIAMYVGMSVMAAAGSAVVLKKRED